MGMNEPEVNNAIVMSMFMAIRNSELKNVRTLQCDSKDMVKMITKYIIKESERAASRAKGGDGQ